MRAALRRDQGRRGPLPAAPRSKQDRRVLFPAAFRRALSRWALFAVTLALVLVLFFPILWMVRISLTAKPDLFILPPKPLLQNINLDGYRGLLARTNFLRYYLNSIIVAAGTVLVCLIAGMLAAYSFSRFEYRGKKALMVAALSAQMFPWALLLISVYIFFIRLRMLDTYLGLIVAHSTFALPLTIWITKSYFDTIPRELEESAFMDGCGHMRTLMRIIIPVSYPGILAAGIYVFIFSWNDFLFGLTLTSKDHMRILAPGIALSFIGEYEYRWVEMMSTSIAITIPVVILFLLLQRYFIEGLTAGALKE
jgi:multiple sugar transport system permease protein